MKTIILSINSQYVHTLLSPRYLKENSSQKDDIEILETNVNTLYTSVLSQLYSKSPDVVAISCYIFNIEFVRKILQEIKLFLPNVKVIVGGWETSFDQDRYLSQVDYLIKGEGDFVFGQLLADIKSGTNHFGKVIDGGIVEDLDSIASPYTDEYCALGKSKILYMESTRGCPYSCAYCMSGNSHRVRKFSIQRTFDDYAKLMKYEPKQIKMVDRTFNYDIKRATTIFRHLIENYNDHNTNFHFEMAPELFDEEMFQVLSTARKGLFQFEIGVQSYNPITLQAVGRNANVQRIEQNLLRLAKMDNIHIHTDLIAGLPYENLKSFVTGFDRLYGMHSDCLQLGFLKVLKGSRLEERKDEYLVQTLPPYEIISTPYLSYDEILQLKICESALERYHNSGRFVHTLDFLLPSYYSPYAFFYGLGKYIQEIRGEQTAISAPVQCDLLYDYVRSNMPSSVTQKEDFLHTLFDKINQDFCECGNARKWKRHFSSNPSSNN